MLVEVVLLEVVRTRETLSTARVRAHERFGVRIVRSLVAPEVRDPSESPLAISTSARVRLFACLKTEGMDTISTFWYCRTSFPHIISWIVVSNNQAKTNGQRIILPAGLAQGH